MVNFAEAGKRCNILVGLGAILTLLHLCVSEYKNDDCSTDVLIAAHQLLVKLGPKGMLTA